MASRDSGNGFPGTPGHRVFFFLVLAFCLLTYAHEVVHMAAFSDFGDFGHYYFWCKAARLHFPVYSLDERSFETLGRAFGMPPFVHPTFHTPAFFLVFNWISLPGYRAAALMWLLLNNLLLAGSVAMLIGLAIRHIPVAPGDRAFFVGGTLVFVTLFQPLFEGLFLGQVGIVILFLLTLGLWLLEKKKQYAAGMVFAVGLLIKPHLIMLLLLFPWKRCWRPALSAAATLVFIEWLSILSWPALEQRYWMVELPGYFVRKAAILASPDNYSFPALIYRVAGFPALQRAGIVFSTLCSLALLAFVFYRTRGRFVKVDRRFLFEFCLFLMLPLIVFMLTHEHHYVLLFIPLILVWGVLQKKREYGAMFIAAFLLLGLRYNLIQFSAFRQGLPALLTGIKLFGLLILFYLVVRLRGEEGNA